MASDKGKSKNSNTSRGGKKAGMIKRVYWTTDSNGVARKMRTEWLKADA